MIGPCLSNKNKNTTVSKSKKFCELKPKALSVQPSLWRVAAMRAGRREEAGGRGGRGFNGIDSFVKIGEQDSVP